MPFVLCNALAMFMKLMVDILFPFIVSFIIVYMDDTMVYNST